MKKSLLSLAFILPSAAIAQNVSTTISTTPAQATEPVRAAIGVSLQRQEMKFDNFNLDVDGSAVGVQGGAQIRLTPRVFTTSLIRVGYGQVDTKEYDDNDIDNVSSIRYGLAQQVSTRFESGTVGILPFAEVYYGSVYNRIAYKRFDDESNTETEIGWGLGLEIALENVAPFIRYTSTSSGFFDEDTQQTAIAVGANFLI